MKTRHPVPLAVLNLLAIEGYEAVPDTDSLGRFWAVRRISDGEFVSTLAFDSVGLDYVRLVASSIARHRGEL